MAGTARFRSQTHCAELRESQRQQHTHHPSRIRSRPSRYPSQLTLDCVHTRVRISTELSRRTTSCTHGQSHTRCLCLAPKKGRKREKIEKCPCGQVWSLMGQHESCLFPIPVFLLRTHTHTHTHLHTYAYVYTHMHTRVSHTRACMPMHSPHIQTCAPPCSHIDCMHLHTHASTHKHECAHTYARTRIRTHT